MYAAKVHNPPLAATLIAIACAFIAYTTLAAKTLASGQFGPPMNPFQIVRMHFIPNAMTWETGTNFFYALHFELPAPSNSCR